MQGEAKSEGWLSIKNEFSWLYPWYKLDVEVNIGSTYAHMAFNPLLPGDEVHDFSPSITDIIVQTSVSVLVGYLVLGGTWRYVRATGNVLAGAIAIASVTTVEARPPPRAGELNNSSPIWRRRFL
jgi:hypothetical protein